MKKNKIIFFFFFSIIILAGCTEKFDLTQFDLDTSGSGTNVGGDTVYIKLNPDWEGFNGPQDIIIGKEPFVYVADTDNNRVVMLNLDGQILGTKTIKHPVALAQDFKLNLIVCAEFDTTLSSGVTQTIGAVYKINLVAAQHQIENAPIIRLLPRASDLNKPARRYTGATVFFDNRFYIARTGPQNSSIFDPDNSILFFSPKKFFGGGEGDTLIGRIPNIDPISSGLVSANQISSLTSFNNRSLDLIITLIGQNSFKTQWLAYVVTPISEKYESKFNPADGVSFITPNKFERPEGTTLDNSGNIYVADAAKDSVFKFNAFGDELQSFGGSAIFKEPYAVAFFDKVLYVADKGAGKIMRFILSTDL